MLSKFESVKSNLKSTQDDSLELLLVQVGEDWVGVRVRQVLHLSRFEPTQLVPAQAHETLAVPPLLGWFGLEKRPVLDFGALLHDTPASPAPLTGQIMLVENERMILGFLIQAAQEIERAKVADLYLLPALIEQMLLRPAVWALWQRRPDELVPLVAPDAAFDPAHRQALLALSRP